MIQNKRKYPVKLFALTVSFILCMSSCINDSLEDCVTNIRFNYSYNMLNSNAFGDQVDEVTLYIFDEAGVLIQTIHDQGDHITNDYVIQMKAKDLAYGKYQFVVWAQNNKFQEAASNFLFPEMKPGQSTIDELKASLKLIENSPVFDSNLNNLLVGYAPTQFVNQSTHSNILIDTKKITNKVRVVLVETAEIESSRGDYKIRIEDTDGNGTINYNYEVIKDKNISYLPYYYDIVYPREGDFGIGKPMEKDNVITAEFALSRLIEENNIRLIIENKDGKSIMDKSLLDFIRLLEQEENTTKWSFQEYLDRQDQYSITIYVNGETSTWLQVVVIINGWVLNLIDIEL